MAKELAHHEETLDQPLLVDWVERGLSWAESTHLQSYGPQVLDDLIVPTDDECETELRYALCESELPLVAEEMLKPLQRLL